MNKNKSQIIKHIDRLVGQLNAVKREIEKDDSDCKKSSQVLYAASRSFASLRETFIERFLEQEFLKRDVDSNKLKKLLTLIKG